MTIVELVSLPVCGIQGWHFENYALFHLSDLTFRANFLVCKVAIMNFKK